MNEIQVDIKDIPFNLDYTLSSGQAFRWVKQNEWWNGVIKGRFIKIKQDKKKIIAKIYPGDSDKDEEIIKEYFRLDDDLDHILETIRLDNEIKKATNRFNGLRLMNQEPWECLVSYICATNKNIPAIMRNIELISRMFGKKIMTNDKDHYSFPTPSDLSKAKMKELRKCELGYRAEFVKATAKRVTIEGNELNKLIETEYEIAKRSLLFRNKKEKIYLGVGPKVADCVLLFSLNKMEAFPIDRWIKRCIMNKYSNRFSDEEYEWLIERTKEGDSLTDSEYNVLSETMRDYFGKYSGYAQAYLYMNSRMEDS